MNRALLPFKAFYFFIFAALAVLLPYLTVYYESLGLSGKQIGVLAALPPLITFISAPFFGAITDVTQRHKHILGISILSVTFGVLAISSVRDFPRLVTIVIFYAFFFAPILPLIDRSVLDVLGSEKDQYGKQRLWGAIGWGMIAPIAGWFIERGGLRWAFYGCALLLLVLFGVSRVTPVRRVSLQDNFWRGLSKLFSSWQVVLFFFVMLVSGMGLAMIHNYLFLYLSHLGASSVMMGWALTIATASELVVMYFSDRLLKSWKARGLIVFALIMLTLRLILYSVAKSPEMALLVQLLHGQTFAAVWMAGVSHVAVIAPPGLGNTAQGLFTGVVMGLGSALGAFLGGILYQGIGFSQMFLGMGVTVLVALLIFVMGCCSRQC